MNYTVVWKREAEDELADFWMAAIDRQSIAAAAHRLERALGDHPLTIGESRNETTRVAFDGPLGVFYEVSDADRLVTVLKVLRVG
jgi:hypothetical protein